MKAFATLALTCSLTLLSISASAYDLGKELKKAIEQKQPAQQEAAKTDSQEPPAATVLGVLKNDSEEDEIAIGRQIAGNLLGAAPLLKDKALQKYVNNVGRWIALQSERPDLPWHFGVIESNDVNAFAAPGGYIFVTRGLYRLLGSEAELAGVLAHEIGHVIRQHHLKILKQSRLVDLGGKLLSKQAGKSQQVQNLIGNGAEVVARSLDKNAEFEADRIAVVLASRAGYDAYGLPVTLQQIGHFAKDDSQTALLFKTHPHPEERLTRLGDAMGERFDRIKGQTQAARFYKLR